MTERVRIWTEYLKEDLLTPICSVKMYRMLTFDNLGFDRVHDMLLSQQKESDWSERVQAGEGESGSFYAVYPSSWGRKWEYGWFWGKADLSELDGFSLEGKRLELIPNVGGEMLVEINGMLCGSKDLWHETIPLTSCANGNETFDILIESYAGHGPRLEDGGPSLYGKPFVPEPPLHQAGTKECLVCIRNEDAYQLYLDLLVLSSLYRTLDPKSLRAQRVLEAMFSASKIMDLECPREDRNRSYRKAREVLKPVLEAKNGTTEADFAVFGQSHLDLAWMWTVEETRRKCARTYSNQLALLEEYPSYRFFGCSPYLLELLERDYPDLYKRVMGKVREGRIVIDGGMYVEPDVQMPYGECLIRQILYAQKWSESHTGRRMELLWLPDTFGFSGQLPQIMAKCGLKYFSSQKLSRAFKGNEPFPYADFLWEGLDGTRVQAHFFKKNNCAATPETFHERWYKDRVQEEHIGEMLFPFGFGDGGGGATRDMVEAVERMRNLEGIPVCHYEDPVSFLKRLAERTSQKLQGCESAEDVNVYRGELYLRWHRGVWSGQAELKRLNRRAEEALREADLWSAIAIFSGQMEPENVLTSLSNLWKELMFLQFHDVLPGTGIEQVIHESERSFLEIIQKAAILSLSAKKVLNPRQDLLWNPVSVPRNLNTSGAVLPPCGYRSSNLLPPCETASVRCMQEGTNLILENAFLRVSLDGKGQILSLLHEGIEFLKAPANVFHLYKNLNTEYDAWELTSYYRYEECHDALSSAEISDYGTRKSGISMEAYADFHLIIGNSQIKMTVSLCDYSKAVTVEIDINWNETHKILQVAFPTIVHTDRLLCETQYGYVARPTGSDRSAREQYEGCMHRYCAVAGDNLGVILLNDSSYSCSAEGGTMAISLLRAAKRPDGNADIGEHQFRYAILPYLGTFSDQEAAADGRLFNIPAEDTNPGTNSISEEMSWFAIQPERKTKGASGILIDWVKTAEDGSGDLILRVYESMNAFESAVLITPLSVSSACFCNALEESETDIPLLSSNDDNTVIPLRLTPFSFRTIRFVRTRAKKN